MKENIINKEDKTKETIILAILLFIPAFIQALINLSEYKQILIGTIVNTLLFLSAYLINDKKKILALATMPSISTILTGILFTGFVKYSSLMLPIIWISNLSLVYSLKMLNIKSNKIISSAISIVIKVAIIYIGFNIISNLFNYPTAIIVSMKSSMGIKQLYTASIGYVISNLIIKLKK